MARSTPFTRLIISIAEDLTHDVENQKGELKDYVSDVRRLVILVMDDPRFQDEIPKEMRERMQNVIVR